MFIPKGDDFPNKEIVKSSLLHLNIYNNLILMCPGKLIFAKVCSESDIFNVRRFPDVTTSSIFVIVAPEV